MIGQSTKGVAADCIRFVCAWLNEMYGTERVTLKRLPQDTAMHNRAGAVAALRQVIRSFPEAHECLDEGFLEPGDVVITAKPGCGPGHSMIVSAIPNVLWHCTGQGVQRAGIGVLAGDVPQLRPYALYRMLNKSHWTQEGRSPRPLEFPASAVTERWPDSY